MPCAKIAVDIEAPSDAIFDLIHDYSRRLEWDPFLRKAHMLGKAQTAGRGVEARCVARWTAGGLAMDTVYVSFNRPRIAAVTMVRGPFFLRTFAASIRQESKSATRTRLTYQYSFDSWPRRLSWPIDRLVSRIFHRETSLRLKALKLFMEAENA